MVEIALGLVSRNIFGECVCVYVCLYVVLSIAVMCINFIVYNKISWATSHVKWLKYENTNVSRFISVLVLGVLK
jgi:predicted Na+-dependent transporter